MEIKLPKLKLYRMIIFNLKDLRKIYNLKDDTMTESDLQKI